MVHADSAEALDKLAAELGSRGLEARLITPAGKEPWLAVRNPQAPMLAETVMAVKDWYWWPWADRIAPVDDVAEAATRVASVLRAGGNGGG